MAQVINTNIGSINAQRQLNKTQNMMDTAMERLASGLRINSAKDDAAGLAISTRFNTQVRGLDQAVRNANDGISLAQTAEASMQEMTSVLQRMRELSVQSANSTNSSSDRASIQSEVDQLFSELDRIAESTAFNGTNLLDGSASNLTFQIGANANQTLDISVGSVTTQALSLNASSSLGELNSGRVTAANVGGTGDVEINGFGLTAASAADIGGIVGSVNSQVGNTGVSATAYNTVTGLSGATGGSTDLVINADTVENATSLEDLVTKINRDVAGVTATLNSGAISLNNDTGESIVIDSAANTGLSSGTFEGFIALSSADDTAINITLGSSGAAGDVNALGFNLTNGSSEITSAGVASTALSTSSDFSINGQKIGESASANAADKAAAINAVSNLTNVTADASTTSTFSNLDFTQTVLASTDVQINGVDVDLTNVENVNQVVSSINDAEGLQGITATTDANTGALVLSSEDGLDISVQLADGSQRFFGSDVANATGDTLAQLNVDTTTLAAELDGGAGYDLYVSIEGATAVSVALDSGVLDVTGLASAFNDVAGVDGSVSSDGRLQLEGTTSTDSIEVFVGITNSATILSDIQVGESLAFDANVDFTASETSGSISLSSSDNEDILVEGTASDVALVGLVTQGGSQDFAGLGLSVSTLENATNAIERIDAALDTISSRRGELGAVQNRLTSTISNLSSISQNLAAANSRIQDADFASETASMTKTQILQQAGISILSQANASSQSVLSLLG